MRGWAFAMLHVCNSSYRDNESYYSLKCDGSIATKSNILPLWVSLYTIFNETNFSLTTTEDISHHILVCDRFCMKLIKSDQELLCYRNIMQLK